MGGAGLTAPPPTADPPPNRTLLLPMGITTLPQRPKPGLLDHATLWDTTFGDVGPAEVVGNAERTDHLSGFRAAIVSVRLATTAVSLVLAGTAFARGDWLVILAGLVILGHTLFRALVPLVYTGSPGDQGLLLLEVALFWVILAATGFWQSPMVIASAAILVVAGFAGGFRLALRLGGATTISLTILSFAVGEWTTERMSESVRWSALLLLTAVVAAYGRRVSGEATRRNSVNLDRISRLTNANHLLANLQRVAQTLPASLDRTEVLDSCLTELRGLLEFDRGVVLGFEPTDDSWSVARRQAVDLAGRVEVGSLPHPAQRAIATNRTATQPSGGLAGHGLHPESVGGMYAPLIARDRLVGLVAVESRTVHYDARDLRAFQAFIEPLALALDNANLFGKLRRATVDEERSRIARELHDRVGQTLASLGFDIDRLIRHEAAGNDIGPDLNELREGVRAMTGEVRETLYDLRSDVAESKDLEHVIAEFAGRVEARSNLSITIDAQATERLPLLQEREMWRVAQEAIINAERHAEASEVVVRWRCHGRSAELQISDDGRGMDVGRNGRIDSYGIVGMRERASGIGATLEIHSKPEEGTTVRCYLSQR